MARHQQPQDVQGRQLRLHGPQGLQPQGLLPLARAGQQHPGPACGPGRRPLRGQGLRRLADLHILRASGSLPPLQALLAETRPHPLLHQDLRQLEDLPPLQIG